MRINRFIVIFIVSLLLAGNFIGTALGCCGVTCGNPCTQCDCGETSFSCNVVDCAGCNIYGACKKACTGCNADCWNDCGEFTGCCCTSCTFEEVSKLYGTCYDWLCVINPGPDKQCNITGNCPDSYGCSDDFCGGTESTSCSEYVDSEGYTRYCKVDKCPSLGEGSFSDPVGIECVVAHSCTIVGVSCEMQVAEGVWDMTWKRCVQCGNYKGTANREVVRVCGTDSDLASYITNVGQCKQLSYCGSQNIMTCWDYPAPACEVACGADSACDGVGEGQPCDPSKGICDSLPMGQTTCFGQKCVNCKCEQNWCGNKQYDSGKEECDYDGSGNVVPSTACSGGKICDPATCKCVTNYCGDGNIGAGEECDPGPPYNPGPIGCIGAASSGVGTKECVPVGQPDECKCKDCGDGHKTGSEACDPGVPGVPCGGGATCTKTCTCPGATTTSTTFAPITPDEICDNEIDDEPDGDTDCEDDDCPEPNCGSACREAICKHSKYNDYKFHCELKTTAECSIDDECPEPGAQECDTVSCTCDYLMETPSVCGNGDDDDHDGCTDGEDVDCGGMEISCTNGDDDNCDGLIDCADPYCANPDVECNKCQDLTCTAANNWRWACETKPGEECSTPPECWASTKWCDLETCECKIPPPELSIEWVLEEIGCKIIILLQGIAAGIAALMIAYSGIKWIGSGEGNPATRTEAIETIKSVFIGLAIIIIALQFINYMFGDYLQEVLCPTYVEWHNMVIICGEAHMCGDNTDDICPEDYGVPCDVTDLDCGP